MRWPTAHAPAQRALFLARVRIESRGTRAQQERGTGRVQSAHLSIALRRVGIRVVQLAPVEVAMRRLPLEHRGRRAQPAWPRAGSPALPGRDAAVSPLSFLKVSSALAPAAETHEPEKKQSWQPFAITVWREYRHLHVATSAGADAGLSVQMFAGQVLQCLYGGSPNVSFFKGDGEPQLGPILDMPDNSSSGAVRGPCRISVSPAAKLATRASPAGASRTSSVWT